MGIPMTAEALLRESFRSVEVNDDFTEAILSMNDGSRLCFRHRVGERWAKALDTAERDRLAARVLATVYHFRLNARHLDIQLTDGGRWEVRFQG